MDKQLKRIEVFGDSILRGIQLNPESKKYIIDNNIDIEMLSRKHTIQINNNSKFGCTIQKGKQLLDRSLEKGLSCDAIVMDFGGNDCDFNWKKIAENPDAEHLPNTPISVFVQTYTDIIDNLRHRGIIPILTTLPPLDPQRFFDWFCKGLNKDNIMKWLGTINTIYRYQESYSRAVEDIAKENNVQLVDLRGEFLKSRRIENLFCEDGIHPNTDGQKLITSAFEKFANKVSLSAIA